MAKEKEKDFKLIKEGEVRVRIAPSPTGYFHIATARAALFNYLFAKKNKGTFILRIEDTDKKRSKPEYEEDIINNFKWLGIKWDEGPVVGGKYGPYRQSERLGSYRKYLQKLLEEKKAYRCFCSKEDLEAQKQYLMSIGKPPAYNGKCAELSKETVEGYLKEGKDSIIRFKVPKRKIVFQDLVRGEIEFETELLGDFSIAKNPDEPLYNFACVVDDFEMKISHVLRGEDHISNTPRQILLQEALGFSTPIYAHLPIVLAVDKTKLSKRHGSVSVRDFKNDGYLPEALINFMAFLGWNPGTDREIFSLASLAKEFSLERVKKGGAIFNQKRLDFLNGFYIRQKSIEKLTGDCLPYLVQAGLIKDSSDKEKFLISETGEEIGVEKIGEMVSLYHERLKKLSEISELIDFFLKDKLSYEKEILRWKDQTDKEVKLILDRVWDLLSGIADANWEKEELEKLILAEGEKVETILGRKGDRGYLLWPLRASLTGKKASAGPFEIVALLGKEKTLKRVEEAKKKAES